MPATTERECDEVRQRVADGLTDEQLWEEARKVAAQFLPLTADQRVRIRAILHGR